MRADRCSYVVQWFALIERLIYLKIDIAQTVRTEIA